MSLINTFVEAIKTATKNMANYKEAAKNYTDKVESGLDELEKLIKRLSGCINQLIGLQQDYNVYIQQITQIRLNMQTMLDKQITQAQTDSGKDCDNKIRGLLEQFNAFVQTIGTWEKKGDRFRKLLDDLTKEIDNLCEKANQIMMENEDNKGHQRLEREISDLEAKLGEGNQGGDGGQERGASKQNADDDEQKQSYVQRQAQAMEDGDTERAEEEARRRSASMGVQRRQQQAEQASIARLEAGRANRRGSEGGLTGYDQVGGWQTPQKLESISRYSPIRRVERKKKKKKKRNTKKNNKKRRRKQTKRRRKKRN